MKFFSRISKTWRREIADNDGSGRVEAHHKFGWWRKRKTNDRNFAWDDQPSEVYDNAHDSSSDFNPDLLVKNIHDRTREASIEDIVDDTQTTYSDELPVEPLSDNYFVERFAKTLFEKTIGYSTADYQDTSGLLSLLPDILRTFAQMIGAGNPYSDNDEDNDEDNAETDAGTDVETDEENEEGNGKEAIRLSWLIHKCKHAITEAFRSELASRQKEHSDSGQKVESWLHDHQLQSGHHNETLQTVFSDEGKDAKGSATKTHDTATQGKLGRDYEWVFDTPPFQWLIAKVRCELQLSRSSEDTGRSISKDIRSRLLRMEPKFGKVSRFKPTPSCSLRFILDLDFLSFHKDQGYTEEPGEAFERAITLTETDPDRIQACTTTEYLRQTWPVLGDRFISLMKKTLQNDGRSSGVLTLIHSMEIDIRNSNIEVTIKGPIDVVAEFGELLAWVNTALQASPSKREVAYIPSVALLRPKIPERSTDSSRDYNVFLRKVPKAMEGVASTSGICWRSLFRNPVVVQGYPILKRQTKSLGLGIEMPLEMMTALIGSHRVSEFGPGVFIKAFSRLLVLTGHIGNFLIWHLLENKQGEYISYTDPRLRELSKVTPSSALPVLESSRHVLGWCSRVENSAGGPNANYNIGWSRLPRPTCKIAFEKVSISAGKFVTAGITAAIGKKDRPLTVSSAGDYVSKLEWIAEKFVVLHDLGSRQAWLLDGVSALLHLVRAYLHHRLQNAVLVEMLGLEALKLEEAWCRYSAKDAALAVLVNRKNMPLALHPKPDAISDEDILKGDEEESSHTEKHTSFRFSDKVEDMHHILEQIINYQSDIESEDGVGFRIKKTPRRQLEGFDFMQLVTNDSPLKPQVTTLKATGRGWVDFVRSIDAITLFGHGFGNILHTSDPDCFQWYKVPLGLDYLAARTSDLESIMRRYGHQGDNPWRIKDDIYWVAPDCTFGKCQCSAGAGYDPALKCDRVQVLLTMSHPKLRNSNLSSPKGWTRSGAVIFGHSRKYPLRWGAFGSLKEGDPDDSEDEEQEEGIADSGLGSSVPLEDDRNSSPSNNAGTSTTGSLQSSVGQPTPDDVTAESSVSQGKKPVTTGTLLSPLSAQHKPSGDAQPLPNGSQTAKIPPSAAAAQTMQPATRKKKSKKSWRQRLFGSSTISK